jgi:hypothetical protein
VLHPDQGLITMNSIAPWYPQRSEAFAEDLVGDSADTPTDGTMPGALHALLLCAVPVVVALLGGVVALVLTIT